jgi:hypothetical protein
MKLLISFGLIVVSEISLLTVLLLPYFKIAMFFDLRNRFYQSGGKDEEPLGKKIGLFYVPEIEQASVETHLADTLNPSDSGHVTPIAGEGTSS